MDSLDVLAQKLLDVYQSDLKKDEKFEIVSKLWSEYYRLSSKLGETSELGNQVYLLCENEAYKIQQEPVIKEMDREMVRGVASRLSQVLQNRKLGIECGISEEEAQILLDWSVYNVRSALSGFGIDVQTNSLNGFCELGQALSIMPFERLGAEVTKNKASDTFDYGFNHRFGTVRLPIDRDGKVVDEVYLIDTTYRQFFSSVRCNEGRYYAVEENTGKIANPDPGYFVSDEEKARELLAKGYLKLTNETARFYGEPFYLSSLEKAEVSRQVNRECDYYYSILHLVSDYCVLDSDLNGLNLDFPSGVYKKR